MAIRKEKFGKRPFSEFERARYRSMLDARFGAGFADRNPEHVVAFLQRRDDAITMAECLETVSENQTRRARRLTSE